MSTLSDGLHDHYGRADLLDAIIAWLQQQGKDLAKLKAEDLFAADQFHNRGFAATRALAEWAKIPAGSRIVDLGGGTGGPARFLAATLGCRVDVVDIMPELCRTGEALAKLVNLEDNVRFYEASATATGLADAAYDIVWMQNASMNIEDRGALYAEVNRLLRRGGRYMYQEQMAGDSGPPYYPVGWATTSADSFLSSPEATLRSLLDAGFRLLSWDDETESSREARGQQAGSILAGQAPPNYLSPEVQRMVARNVERSLDEGRLRLARAIFQKL